MQNFRLCEKNILKSKRQSDQSNTKSNNLFKSFKKKNMVCQKRQFLRKIISQPPCKNTNFSAKWLRGLTRKPGGIQGATRGYKGVQKVTRGWRELVGNEKYGNKFAKKVLNQTKYFVNLKRKNIICQKC